MITDNPSEKIGEKARLVCEMLGKEKIIPKKSGGEIHIGLYETGLLRIRQFTHVSRRNDGEVKNIAELTIVYHDGRLVYQEGCLSAGGIENKFVLPGAWENQVNELYQQVIR